MRKVWNVLAVTLAGIMILTGCGGNASSENTKGEVSKEETKQVTLTFMDHTSEEAKIQWEDSVISSFEAAPPGVAR